MFKPADMKLWQGRIDSEESTPSPRWHQVINAAEEINPQESIALLGFCCDEGVARNKGRRGAKDTDVQVLFQRQRVIFMFQENERPLRNLASQRDVFWPVNY